MHRLSSHFGSFILGHELLGAPQLCPYPKPSLLRQATHIYDESLRTLSITPQSFANNSFVIGVGLQTSNSAFSGYNTRSGDLLSVRCKALATDATVNAPAKVYVTMIHEAICEIREGSVAVLD